MKANCQIIIFYTANPVFIIYRRFICKEYDTS